MARANNSTVRIPDDLATMLDGIKGDLSRTEIAIQMINKGLNAGSDSKVERDSTEELDSTVFHQFFKHLSGGEGKKYQDDLKLLALTDYDLVEKGISDSGKNYQNFKIEAMKSYAKEQISLAARRNFQDENTEGSPEKRLQTTFAKLTDEMMNGQYHPKNGRLNVSAVAARAGVNYNTAKKWAESYQPELLN